MDAYIGIGDVREAIGEAVPNYWSARGVLNALNRAQLRIYMEMSQNYGDWFMTSESVSFTSGVGTLPVACSKPAFLMHPTYNSKITLVMDPREQGRTAFPTYEHLTDSSWEGFVYGNTIKLNTSYSGSLTLWYEQVCRDLHAGTAYSGGSEYLHLDRDHPFRMVDDYYNGMGIVIHGGTGMYQLASGEMTARTYYTVTDYTSVIGKLTLSGGTFGDDTLYGLVSILPNEAYDYWIALAAKILITKPSAVIDKSVISAILEDYQDAREQFRDWVSIRVKDNNYMRRW